MVNSLFTIFIKNTLVHYPYSRKNPINILNTALEKSLTVILMRSRHQSSIQMTKQRFIEPTMWPQAYLISQIIPQVQVFHHSLLGSGQVQPEDYACPNKRIVFHECNVMCYIISACLTHTVSVLFFTIILFHFVQPVI